SAKGPFTFPTSSWYPKVNPIQESKKVMEPALKVSYKEKAVPALQEKFSYGNVHQIPTITKVVLNSGFGKEDDRKAAAENVIEDLGKITGQRAVPTTSKIAISNFK